MSYSRLIPKMGSYGKFELPLTFQRFNTKEVVKNARKPNFSTIFDVSHMNIFETNIKNSYKLNNLFYFKNLKKNKSRLSVLLDKNKKVIDDLIISNVDDKNYRLITNANTLHLFENNDEMKFLQKKSRKILAIQGGNSQALLENLLEKIVKKTVNLNNIYFMENKTIYKDFLEICRCGYTGEDGFELYLNKSLHNEFVETLINTLEDPKSNFDIQFGGLIERDILRMEGGLWLSGNEFSDKNPINFASLNSNFLMHSEYRNKFKEELNSKVNYRYFTSSKPIKVGDILDKYDKVVGKITSSTRSFNIDKFIGLGFLTEEDNNIYFKDGKNKKIKLCVQTIPFVKSNYYRKI